MLAWPLIFRGLILRSLFLGTHKIKKNVLLSELYTYLIVILLLLPCQHKQQGLTPVSSTA